MATSIRLKHSATANDVPTPAQLPASGEVAVNTAENAQAVYLRDSANDVVCVAGDTAATVDAGGNPIKPYGGYLRKGGTDAHRSFVAPLLGHDGTTSDCTYSFASDPDLGLYRIGSNRAGFHGVLDGQDGFRVSGGNNAAIPDGMMKTGVGNLGLRVNSAFCFVANTDQEIALCGSQPTDRQKVRLSVPLGDGTQIGYYNSVEVGPDTEAAEYFRTSLQCQGNGGTPYEVERVHLFRSDEDSSSVLPELTIAELAGYYSSISNRSNFTNPYNILVAGQAPNFFQGNTYVGGATTTLGDTTNINLLSNGRGEFTGGVKVTGGTVANVVQGLSYANATDTIYLVNNRTSDPLNPGNARIELTNQGKATVRGSNSGFSIAGTVTGSATLSNGFRCLAAQDSDTTRFNAFQSVPNVSEFRTVTTWSDFVSSYDSTVQGTITNKVGFEVTDNSAVGDTTNYGLYSQISSSRNGAFNIYASGTASNYFRGTTRVAQSDDVDPAALDNKGIQMSPTGQLKVGYNSATAENTAISINRSGTTTGRLIQFRYGKSDDNNLAGSIDLVSENESKFNETSDYRLKENIVDLPSAVDVVKGLRPVNFNFKANSEKLKTGFIAHELQEVVPDAASGVKDEEQEVGTLYDAEGNILEEGIPQPDEAEMSYEEVVEISPYISPIEAVYDNPELVSPEVPAQEAVYNEDGEEVEPATPFQEAVYAEPVLLVAPREEQAAVTETVVKQKTWTKTGTVPIYQGIYPSSLIPLLTKALQEALERIEVLEAAAGGRSTKSRTRSEK